MIVRLWRGRAAPDRPDAYPEHFRAAVLPALATTPGFLGATLLRAAGPQAIEFVALTRWRSLDAIRAFAGADISQAVVEPGAAAALSSYDTHATHYEVVVEAPPPA
jgi:heme-degrading monooxygenase HmoA